MPSALTFSLKYVYRWGNVKQREMASSDVFCYSNLSTNGNQVRGDCEISDLPKPAPNENARRKRKTSEKRKSLKLILISASKLNLCRSWTWFILHWLFVSSDRIWSSMWDLKFMMPTSLYADRLWSYFGRKTMFGLERCWTKNNVQVLHFRLVLMGLWLLFWGLNLKIYVNRKTFFYPNMEVL